jgi:Zinc finger, C2H2 type
LSDFNAYCLEIEAKHADSLAAVFVKCDDYQAPNTAGLFRLLEEHAIKTEDYPKAPLETNVTPSIEEDAVKSEQIGVYVDSDLFEPEYDQNESCEMIEIEKKAPKKPMKKLRHKPKTLAVKVRDKATMLSRQMQSFAWGDANEDCIKQFCLLECKLCPIKEFDSWKEMKTHHEKVHHTEGSVVCSCCNEEFKKRYKILDHVVPKVRPDEFKCLFCGIMLKTQANLKLHMEAHDQKTLNSYRFKCDKCPKSFKFLMQLESHSVVHMEKSEKKLQCPKCEKKYFLEIHLRGHMQRYHNKDAHKFLKVCDACGKTFEDGKALQRHHQLLHATEKPLKVQCYFCEKWYLKMYILKHIRTYHTNNSLAERTCPICGMVYTTSKAARRHLKTFHEKTNSFHCTICDKHIMRKLNFEVRKPAD